MNFPSTRSLRPLAAALLLCTVAACGGGGDRGPVLGFDDTATPIVPVVTPGVRPPSPSAPSPNAVALASAAGFGSFGGSAGITNEGTQTVINNGAIGTTAASTLITGFHDAGPGCTYTETGSNIGNVTGGIFTAAPPPTVACPSEGTTTTANIASKALADAQAAFNALKAKPPGPFAGAGNLAGLTLAPGTYTSPSTYQITGGNLTLDGGGDNNSVWVFQMGTSLTVGAAANPASVILTNGAHPQNVFWQVGSAATINGAGGGTMVGTIISQSGVTFSTSGNAQVVTLNGRALSLGAVVTMTNTVINVP
jgi:hypothetical protein